VDLERIKKQLMDHEGYGPKVYEDTVGILTIGYGRNLEGKGITEAEAEYLLVNDIREVENELRERLPFFENLSSIRQEILISMGYNLGINGLLKFKKMLAALENTTMSWLPTRCWIPNGPHRSREGRVIWHN